MLPTRGAFFHLADERGAMDSNARFSRRRLLAAAGSLAVVPVAGCLDSGDDSSDSADGDDSTGDDESEPASTDEPDTPQDDGSTPADTDAEGTGSDDEGGTGTDGGSDTPEEGTDTPASDTLDLREANVVDVAFEERDGAYAFDVTLHHDDDGEEGYANWWQVERLDGERLGRRELLHAHSRQPFTRSETIDVPGDVTCVVVRGHDQTHGYGGRAMLVDLASGELRAVDQGEERQSFDEADCP
jgi:hypothetical protein